MSQNIIIGTWTVVKFIKDDSVEAVPTNWITGDSCSWPRYPKDRLLKAIKFCEPPLPSWEQHKISSFRNATYDEYVIARKKCQKAENTSDLNSDVERKRSISIPARLQNLSESSENSDSDDSIPLNKPTDAPHCPSISFKKSATENNVDTAIHIVEDKLKNIENTAMQVVDRVNPRRTAETKEKDNENIPVAEQCNCCPHHKDKTNELLKQILRKISMLELTIADIKSDINLKKNQIESEESVNIWSEFNLPLQTHEELLIFDNFLKEPENISKSVIELAKLGGDTCYDFVRRALKKLVTNKLAAEYSWIGLKKKKAFAKLTIVNLLIGSAQKRSDWTTKEVEEIPEAGQGEG